MRTDLHDRMARSCGGISDHLFEVGRCLLGHAKTLLPLMMMASASPTRMPHFHERATMIHPVRLRMIRLLTAYLEAEIRKDRLRAVDAEILARMFLGVVHHCAMSELVEQSADALPLAAGSYLRAAINILLEGAGARCDQRATGRRRLLRPVG